MSDYIDHENKIIVIDREIEFKAVSLNWHDSILRNGCWHAYIESESPGTWCAKVAGYMISDRPVAVSNSRMSRTFSIYYDSEDYVKQLAGRLCRQRGHEQKYIDQFST